MNPLLHDVNSMDNVIKPTTVTELSGISIAEMIGVRLPVTAKLSPAIL